MKRTRHHQVVALTVAVFAAAMIAGCGDGDADARSSADTSTTSEDTSTASSALPTYSSKAFVVPLTVSVDPVLKSPPTDSPNLLTWDGGPGLNGAPPDPAANAVRFFVPVDVFRPGSQTREAAPEDFQTYLLGQADHGAAITDLTDITVDGREAKLMTLTRSDDRPENDLHGSLGCLERGADPRDGCFGIEPDRILRLAVIDMGDTTLLTWARVNKDNPDEAFVDMFEEMLTTVRFR